MGLRGIHDTNLRSYGLALIFSFLCPSVLDLGRARAERQITARPSMNYAATQRERSVLNTCKLTLATKRLEQTD